MNRTLGERLSQFRKKWNLSQDELAQQLNVSRQSISNWESDQAMPSIDYIKDLSKIYNVSIDDLLNLNKDIESCYNKEDNDFKKDRVHVGKDGIFIQDEEDDISITWSDGIKINSNGNNFCYDNKTGDFVKKCKPLNKKSKYHKSVADAIFSTSLLITLIIYIILGSFVEGAWGSLWPIIFLGFIPSEIYKTFALKNVYYFPIIFISLFIYLFLGSYLSFWHPYRVILFLIPIYYSFVSSIRRIKIKTIDNN